MTEHVSTLSIMTATCCCPLEVMEHVFWHLPISDVGLQLKLLKTQKGLTPLIGIAKLRWAIRNPTPLSSIWELRLDLVRMLFDTKDAALQQPRALTLNEDELGTPDEPENSDEAAGWKPIVIKSMFMREPMIGDRGPLGICHWTSQMASLWKKYKTKVIRNGHACRSLEMQAAALLSMWSPVGATAQSEASFGSAMDCDREPLLRLVRWLGPSVSDGVCREDNFDGRLSIQGNLLEVFAVSSNNPGELVEPVARLVGCGATARGNFVLEALRRSPQHTDLRTRWLNLWTKVAAAELERRCASFQPFGAPSEVDEDLLDALVAGIATNVRASAISHIMYDHTCPGTTKDALRFALLDALSIECAIAA
jgi:hypothetical protein